MSNPGHEESGCALQVERFDWPHDDQHDETFLTRLKVVAVLDAEVFATSDDVIYGVLAAPRGHP